MQPIQDVQISTAHSISNEILLQHNSIYKARYLLSQYQHYFFILKDRWLTFHNDRIKDSKSNLTNGI